jgi:hypothetical protein
MIRKTNSYYSIRDNNEPLVKNLNYQYPVEQVGIPIMLGKLLVPSKIDKIKNVAIKRIIFLSISSGIGTEGSSCILFNILIYKHK